MKGVLDEQVLIDLTDGEGAIVAAVLDEAIARAEDEFDGYGGIYYVIPVRLAGDVVPGIVRTNVAVLAAYNLMARKPMWLADRADLATPIRKRQEQVVSWMRAIASANASTRLLIPDAIEKATPANAAADETWFDGAAPEMTRTALKGIF